MNKIAVTLLICILVGVWALVLQNAGIIPPISQQGQGVTRVFVVNTVDVDGDMRIAEPLEISGRVEIDGPVEIESPQAIDVNLSQVVGRNRVESKSGMLIDVSTTSNTVIPHTCVEVSIK